MNNIVKKISLIQSICLRYKAGKSLKSKSAKKGNPCKKRTLPGKDKEKAGMWRKICLFGVIPSVLGLSALVLTSIHEHERQPFVPYEYLRIHTKRFAWGDGTKSFFHNPHVNPLADGYEDE